MKVAIINHTSIRNRGNEAMLVTIMNEISQIWPGAQFYVGSIDVDYDSSRAFDNNIIFCRIDYSQRFKRFFPSKNKIFFRLYDSLGVDLYKCIWGKSIFEGISNADIVISTGGDLFSSSYGSCRGHLDYVNISAKKKKKVFLLAHSIGPFSTKEELESFKEVMEHVHIITCRESISYEYVRNMNLKNPKVELTADPAFLLPVPDENEMEKLWSSYNLPRDREVIGLALSEGIISYSGADYNKIVSELINFVDWLIKKDYHILLIPHVHGGTKLKDDRIFGERVFSGLNCPSNATIAIHNNTASEYKGLISKCSVLIGARTHSTIASLSSCVPTVAIAYSIKAYGILKEILGDVADDIIVNVDSLTMQNLIRAFEKALEIKIPKNQIEIQVCRAKDNFKLLKELVDVKR